MTKIIFLMVVVFTGLTSSYGQGPTSKSEVANPAAFRKLTVQSQCDTGSKQGIGDCVRRILTVLDIRNSEEGSRIRDEIFHFKSGVSVFLRTVSGLADDSVSAIRYRVSFKKHEGGFSFVQVGVQQLCQPRRGHRGWTKGSCI